MSTFKVTLEVIGDVSPAANADALDLVHLANIDFDFITMKGLYQPGDTVLYFPVDSLLPMWLVSHLGLEGKLAHGKLPESEGEERLRNRVKTIKLRGNISQGVVCLIQDILDVNPDMDFSSITDGDYTNLIGVEKYEPPVVFIATGNLLGMPDMVSTYDIEGAGYHKDIVELLMDVPVYVTEKMEGSNWWASIHVDNPDDVMVGSRNHRIDPETGKDHTFIKTFINSGLRDKMLLVWEHYRNEFPFLTSLTFRGEILGPGVMGNYYQLKDNKIMVFDIEVNKKAINVTEFEKITGDFGVETVPVLSNGVTLRNWLNDKGIKEASNGSSQCGCHKREGIVVRPLVETYEPSLGRVIIKQRSPEYLAKSDS